VSIGSLSKASRTLCICRFLVHHHLLSSLLDRFLFTTLLLYGHSDDTVACGRETETEEQSQKDSEQVFSGRALQFARFSAQRRRIR
jgi:hypothetical protein